MAPLIDTVPQEKKCVAHARRPSGIEVWRELAQVGSDVEVRTDRRQPCP